jgi:hypothetical protein
MGKLLSCLRPSSQGSPTGKARSVPSGADDGASRYCIEPSGKTHHGLYVVIMLLFHLYYGEGNEFICIMAKATKIIL